MQVYYCLLAELRWVEALYGSCTPAGGQLGSALQGLAVYS